MWSGETQCSQPLRRSTPWTVITLEPMPSIAAPMRTSMRARSCTCGSDAALRMTVVPGVSAAAISAFSVPITDGSSMKKSTASQAAVRRLDADLARAVLDAGAERDERVQVRVQPAAADDVAARRRHQRRAEARQQRARGQERGADALGDAGVDRRGRDAPRAAARRCCSSRQSTLGARARRAGRSSPACPGCRGTLCSTTSSSVRRAQASSGRAAFLLPAGTIVPDSGTPPWMTNFSMGGSGSRARWRPRGGVG